LTEHASAPLPRRRDIHRPDHTRSDHTRSDRARSDRTEEPRSRRRAVRAGVPVAITVMALTTGVVTGLSPASGETRAQAASSAPEASSVERIGAGAFGAGSAAVTPATAIERPALDPASFATAGAVGTDEAGKAPDRAEAAVAADVSGDEALSAAQSALTRADHVATESRAVPRDQRRSVAKSAAHLREVLADGTGTAAASRAGERADLQVRAEEATDVAAATDDLTELLETTEADAVAIEPAPATPTEIVDTQAAQARKAAAALKKYADDTEGYENGRLASGDLHELSFAPGESLRRDAAEQLERMDAAYAARFGTHLEVRDSYRSYASQVSVKASRGYLAAVPGYSDHGWGIAVDLNGGVEEYSSAQHRWLVENAGDFGWRNPAWAQADGRKPEAWHWEYKPL
jgi:zinc D-Ala-D-Ala carboxypeptidase